MLSVIIPSYKDKYLNSTVESLLENCHGDIEVICVMDGYWQAPIDEPRVKVVHHGKNRGMREAINTGVRVSTGEYIMRTDEHCVFGEGYDKILIEDLQDNWIMTPLRYFLDVEKWEVMDIDPISYESLIIDNKPKYRKFSGVKDKKATREREGIMVDEIFAMQGSCWIMKRKLWDTVIGELQSEGYGTLYQDSIEMAFKLWKVGGKLMVNKKTWYAHKHRSFNRTHHHSLEGAIPGWEYAISVWGEFYNELVKEKKINHYVPVEFSKYKEYGAYHWKQYEDKNTKYSRHADRVKEWIEEKSILDIGAGDGKITSMLGAVGIEYDKTGVKLAVEHGANVIHGSAYELPFKDGEFEAAFMGDVLEHLQFPNKALKEAWRVIREYLYIAVPEKGTNNDPYHYQEWTPKELISLLESNGFVLEGEILIEPKDKRIYGKFKKHTW